MVIIQIATIIISQERENLLQLNLSTSRGLERWHRVHDWYKILQLSYSSNKAKLPIKRLQVCKIMKHKIYQRKVIFTHKKIIPIFRIIPRIFSLNKSTIPSDSTRWFRIQLIRNSLMIRIYHSYSSSSKSKEQKNTSQFSRINLKDSNN